MALDSPYTGIVDWRRVALQYGQDFEEAGGTVAAEFEVTDISVVKESPARDSGGEDAFACNMLTQLRAKRPWSL